MNPPTTASGGTAADEKRSVLPRWHRLFYLLVAFAVFTVLLSLYLARQYTQIYVRSVAVNQAWIERLHGCSQLGQMAAAVNAPGNDVFQTHEVALEEAKMRVALRLFNERLQAFHDELGTNADAAEAAPLLDDTRAVRQLIAGMAAEAQRLFAYLRSQQPREAGESMAAMDREHARANEVLERLRDEIAAIQKRHFENQTTLATSLQQFQYAVSALILLLIGGAAVFAHRVRRQLEAATRAKETSIAALRESETQLDRRVRERTAELVQANESLRTEVEERRRAEEALRASEGRARALIEARRQLLKKLMSAQEDERRRIAQDLHDEIGQALTSLLIGLRTVAEVPTLEAARGRTEDLRRITLSALEEVRRLARGLRPRVLDDWGLSAALERYAADYAHAHGIAVEVQAPTSDAARLPEEVETALFRIAQEALTNTAKHAAAKQVRIDVAQQPAWVQLTVSDDGRGFQQQEPASGGQLGLSGMHERAALLGGSVHVTSEPGRGTTVIVRLPLAEEKHGAHSCAAGG
jgi:signal transduction histidine kinase